MATRAKYTVQPTPNTWSATELLEHGRDHEADADQVYDPAQALIERFTDPGHLSTAVAHGARSRQISRFSTLLTVRKGAERSAESRDKGVFVGVLPLTEIGRAHV